MVADAGACARHGVDAGRLGESISLLNLNCERLRLARQQLLEDITQWYLHLIDELLVGAPHLTDPQRSELLALLVAGRLQPDEHGHLAAFWTTIRQYLGPPAEAWLQGSR